MDAILSVLVPLKPMQLALRCCAGFLTVAMSLGLYFGGAQPVAVELFPWPWGKLVHSIVFGVLACSAGYATGLRGWRGVVAGFCVSVSVGAMDEWHQLFLPGRHGQLSDLFFDAIGAALGAGMLSTRERLEKRMGSFLTHR